MPAVSVILPFYNRAGTLRRCVESVRAQTWTDWELIAVDDGSADASVRVLEQYNDPRIRILRHENNAGAAAARNTGMSHAQGAYFALIDSDDEWFPGKLAAQMLVLQKSNARLSSTAFHFIRDGRSLLWPKPFQGVSWEKALHCECTFGFGTTLLIARAAALSLNGFDANLPRHEDWDWVLRAFETGEALSFVPEPQARVFATETISLEKFIASTHRFLAKHHAGLGKFGASYRRQVFAHHFQSIASMAYEQRQYACGHGYMLRALRMVPWRNPLVFAAFPVGFVDWLLGTRFIQQGAALLRERQTGISSRSFE